MLIIFTYIFCRRPGAQYHGKKSLQAKKFKNFSCLKQLGKDQLTAARLLPSAAAATAERQKP
jgi:hypothetical protein